MTLDDLKSLLAQIQEDAAAVTDEQLAQATDAIREQVETARAAGATAETVKLLTQLRDVKAAVSGEQSARATAAAEVNAEAERLLADLDTPDPEPAAKVDDAPEGEPVEDVPAEQPELIAASGATDPTVIAQAVAAGIAAYAAQAPTKAAAPVEGRTAKNIGKATPAAAPARDAVRMRVHAAGSDGTRQHGQELTSTADLGRVFADRLRGANGRGANGRTYVASVKMEYPESRTLQGPDADAGTNAAKIAAITEPQALVAAGGLCAPLETLYDVDVVGSTARPIRDQALARFGVDRGGITYRPNDSAASAVYGAGVWTLTDDETPGATKGCYVVECPDLQTAEIEAIFSCLEFGNISTRFDPEITAANVQKGAIAHARLAENRLLAALGAGSKILSAPKVVGATRDVLANLDKATAYYRNRHRIDTNVPLTFVLPGWVKSMFRADISRQMAAGDWMEALSLADAQIATWFGVRGVSPVWHLDGGTGTAEVQTITITGTPTGGTFTLTYDGQTTSAIAYNATAATVRAALEGLSNIDPGEVTTAGGPLPGTAVTVTFAGGEFGNVPQMNATGSLTGGTTPAVAVTTTTGGGGATTVSGVSVAAQTYGDAPAGGALPGFPDQIDSLIYTTGSWLFLDGGSLDLGLVRDSGLNERNRYRQFMETFEGVADRGIESLRLVMTVQPTGGTAGTVDTSGITD